MRQEAIYRWLPFYLRDHMAGARAGVNLFDRVARGHSHQQVRTQIAIMHDEIEQDSRALRTIMEDLGIRRTSGTMLLGVVGELVGRLKPNGSFLKRSAGADVLELEALVAAVQAKARLWETLIALAETNFPLDVAKLRQLQNRATDQRNTIIALHAKVVRTSRAK